MIDPMDANEAERRRWNDEGWTAMWPKRERFTDAVTPLLVDALALRPGERVLEVGSGGGKAAQAAARKVGPEGAVVGADISAALSALATTRATDGGVHNVTFHVVDMQTDHVPGAPFDAAMSQFGVMFFSDPVAAFANVRAHLRSGGRLAFACWQSVDRNPWFFGLALAGIAPPPPPPAPGQSPTGPFTLADPAHVTGILASAGFEDADVRPHRLELELPEDSVVDDAQLRFIGIAPERMDEARAAVDAHMLQFRLPSGLNRFPLAFQIVTATNP